MTQSEYEEVMGVNPSAFAAKQMDISSSITPKGQEDRAAHAEKVGSKDTSRHPVETVSWHQAMEFCRRLSAMPEEQAATRVYRLPTEAQWEYACRAGTTTRWYCGDDEAGLVDVAWFKTNAGRMTHPVGKKKPNAWGLFDMHGNVYHWCLDWFGADYYSQSPLSDPTGPAAGSARILRGSGPDSGPSACRSACRTVFVSARNHMTGFRVVCEIAPKAPTAHAPDDAFIKEVASLPAEQQVARVVAKLKELNPGYDGKEEHEIENGVVMWLSIKNTTIRDISPVRALGKLKRLSCGGLNGASKSPLGDLTPLRGLSLSRLYCICSDVSDLSPLHGMPLTELHCWGTKVTSLTPLQGMPLATLNIYSTLVSDLSDLRGTPLTHLTINSTLVTDLSALKDMPLKELRCNFSPKRDTEILRSIKTLETVNGLPVAEFWKQVDAGKIPSATTGLGKKQEE